MLLLASTSMIASADHNSTSPLIASANHVDGGGSSAGQLDFFLVGATTLASTTAMAILLHLMGSGMTIRRVEETASGMTGAHLVMEDIDSHGSSVPYDDPFVLTWTRKASRALMAICRFLFSSRNTRWQIRFQRLRESGGRSRWCCGSQSHRIQSQQRN